MNPFDLIVVGNTSDDPFAIDVAYSIGQIQDIADLISLKNFANSEFCPRFISDDADLAGVGQQLLGKTVLIISTSNRIMSRQELAMRNMLIARAAKENGALEVVLVEPDLYYSAQDRGPHPHLGDTRSTRNQKDLKKFDGQPFTVKLYAEMLKLAGVDRVVTVHNHSHAVASMFNEVFEGQYHQLLPYEIYVDYIRESNIVEGGPSGDELILCAPDQGARQFVEEMAIKMGVPLSRCLLLDKQRSGERKVAVELFEGSECSLADVEGKDVVLFDDMVRTGSTLIKTCQFLRHAKPRRIVFAVTHFYASEEGRIKLADAAIDEILTLNTLPTILNRDEQGRLRRKLVVLKIENWLAQNLAGILDVPWRDRGSFYNIDMSSKNPRFTRKILSNEQLKDLKVERSQSTLDLEAGGST